MHNQEKEISLSQLLSVFKKSFKRALLYVLVSVVVAAAVLIPVKAFTGVKTYSSTVSFAKAQVNMISSLNAGKANVVNLALIDSNQSLELSEDVIKSLSVTAVVPEKNEEDDDFIPTNYEIVLKPNSNLKLSAGEYTTLVDNVAKHYVNVFSKATLPSFATTYDAKQAVNHVEYMQASVNLSDYVQNYINSINSYVASNSAIKNFREDETGKSVQDIISELTFINTELDALNVFIVSNKVEKSTNSLERYLDLAHSLALADYNKYTAELQDAQSAFDKYVASPSVQKDENGITYITYDETLYTELWEAIKTASDKKTAAKGSADKLEALANSIGVVSSTPEEDKAYAVEMISILSESVAKAMSDYNLISNTYNDNQYLTSDATLTRPAHKVIDNIISTKILIISLFAVALIAYVVAFSQTYSMVKTEINTPEEEGEKA